MAVVDMSELRGFQIESALFFFLRAGALKSTAHLGFCRTRQGRT